MKIMWTELLTCLMTLRLHGNLLRRMNSHGFEKSSAIQQRAIKPLLDGHDTIGQAQSGTGKTATFVAGCLRKIDYTRGMCQALGLPPMHELVQQTQKVALTLDDYLKIRKTVGARRYRKNPRWTATGCGDDMISKCHLCMVDIMLFVLDEADEMLIRMSMDQIYDIFKC